MLIILCTPQSPCFHPTLLPFFFSRHASIFQENRFLFSWAKKAVEKSPLPKRKQVRFFLSLPCQRSPVFIRGWLVGDSPVLCWYFERWKCWLFSLRFLPRTLLLKKKKKNHSVYPIPFFSPSSEIFCNCGPGFKKTQYIKI